MATAPIFDDPIAALLAKMRLRDDVSEHEAAVLRALIMRLSTFGGPCPGRSRAAAHRSLLADRRLCRPLQGYVGRRAADQPRSMLPATSSTCTLPAEAADHNIGALTAVRMAIISHSAIVEIRPNRNRISPACSGCRPWSTPRSSANESDAWPPIGIARVAHCSAKCRRGWNDRAGRRPGLCLPVVQADLADASGLTRCTFNRMLRELRERGLMTSRAGSSKWRIAPARAARGIRPQLHTIVTRHAELSVSGHLSACERQRNDRVHKSLGICDYFGAVTGVQTARLHFWQFSAVFVFWHGPAILCMASDGPQPNEKDKNDQFAATSFPEDPRFGHTRLPPASC